MKITLDLTDLVAKGKITAAEADRLQALAAADTGALGTNILLAFGTVAVALGAGFLLPSAPTAIVIGAILAAAGLWLRMTRQTHWLVFSQIITVVGALCVVGGVWFISEGSVWVNLALAAGLAVAAVAALSGLLAALSVLMLAAALGSGTAYWSASYFFGVEQPALTILVLGALATGLVALSKSMPAQYERLAIIAARTAVLMVNGAFLVGSLFGDDMVRWPSAAFSIVWAVLLIGVGIWGVVANRRWVVNTAAVFGALHFYTQWFEWLGAQAFSIFGGGLLLIAFGLLLARFNNWIGSRRERAPA